MYKQQERPAQNGIEIDLKDDGSERDGIQPVSTAGVNEVISESTHPHELGIADR